MAFMKKWPGKPESLLAGTGHAYPIDPVEFAQKCLGFTPDPVQAEILRSESHRIILCMGRRCGKTFSVSTRALHFALTHPGTVTLIISRSERQAGILMAIMRSFLSKLNIRRRGDGFNPGSFLLPNESRIIPLPPRPETIAGFTPDLVVLDEAGLIPDPVYDEVRPMLAYNDPTLILLSTPRGRRGFFYREWTAPEEHEQWARFFAPASTNPRVSQEFLTRERLRRSERLFLQNFECQFLDAGNSFFPDALLDRAIDRSVVPFDLRAYSNIHEFPKSTTHRSLIASLDLGQSYDPSAFAIMESIRFLSPDFDPVRRMHPELKQLRVRHLEALPLGTPYKKVVDYVVGTLNRLKDAVGVSRIELVIDATSLGTPVVEIVREAKPNCGIVPVVITAGDAPTLSGDTHRVPKRDLMNRLHLALDDDAIRIPHTLPSLHQLEDEFKNFKLRHTANGHDTYSASEGHHDDLLIALALAAWRG